MARAKSSSAQSTANLGFEAKLWLTAASEGEKTHRSVDLLGRVYEYFLTRFASAEGKNGGQFYTPSCVVRWFVEPVPVRKDLAPCKGRIYDPACGSGGMFVQSEKFVESHGGTAMRDSAKPIGKASTREFCEAKHHRGDISIYGQESNATTRRLAVMNLAIRGIEADFGVEHADTFRRDLHPDLRADTATRVSAKPKLRSHLAGLLRSERQLLANPPFNDSDWFRKDDDVRFFSLSASNGDLRSAGSYERNSLGVKARCGPSKRARASHWAGVRCRNDLPPKGNANFAWVQHFIRTESRTLATRLPKLLSGKLSVTNLEN